ncbi:MAG: hypothetical protein AB7V50_06835, partial [Vampirovibrionia bacterium]
YNRLEQAFFYITKIFSGDKLAGYDINEDGKLDVRVDEVSDGKPVLQKYIGKPLSSFVVDEDSMQAIKEEQQKPLPSVGKVCDILRNNLRRLFSLSDLQVLFNEDCSKLKKFGEFAYAYEDSDNVLFDMTKLLKVDEDGNLYYDPLNRGIKNAFHFFDGTSYSSPLAINKDIVDGKISYRA